MLQRFQTMTPKKQFMALLLCYFGLDVLWGLISVLSVSGIIPLCNVIVLGRDLSVTSCVLNILEMILKLMVLLKMYKTVPRKARTGLGLLMAGTFSPVVSTVTFFLLRPEVPQHSMILSLISASFFVLNVVGLFMFIGGSPVEKKVKVFLMCTPFITLIFSTAISFFISQIPDLWSIPFTWQLIYMVLFTIYFVVLYLMLREPMAAQE